MNDIFQELVDMTDNVVPANGIGANIAADPMRAWAYKLRHTWNENKGCVCTGAIAQGGTHSVCILFAGVSGASSSSLSHMASTALQGNGLIGLTAAETFQYIAAPVLAVPMSYAVDVWRKRTYSLSKAGIAIAVSAGVAAGIAYKWPHQHDADIAVTWFEGQSKDEQQKIRQFAINTNQTVNDVVLGMCSSNPKIQAEIDRLKTPAYQRVYGYFAR